MSTASYKKNQNNLEAAGRLGAAIGGAFTLGVLVPIFVLGERGFHYPYSLLSLSIAIMMVGWYYQWKFKKEGNVPMSEAAPWVMAIALLALVGGWYLLGPMVARWAYG